MIKCQIIEYLKLVLKIKIKTSFLSVQCAKDLMISRIILYIHVYVGIKIIYIYFIYKLFYPTIVNSNLIYWGNRLIIIFIEENIFY